MTNIKFNLAVVVDSTEYMAGSISVPIEILKNDEDFLEFLEDLNYLTMGYDDNFFVRISKDFKNFDILFDSSIILTGYGS